ncbi:Putative dimethyl sulfoxide reductase chain YnfE [bacterium HR40]|nr:Putative dimethyl sulfoxide reductase chain YnfE [bacterium HR40]
MAGPAFHPAVCPHDCPSVCALEVEKLADGTLGRVRGSERNRFTAGVVCAKVARYRERLHHPDRLLYPLLRTGPKGSKQFRRISWNEALDRIAEALSTAERRFGAETVWPYWYAGTMGLVQRDGINRLTHAKKWSRFHSTICVTLADTGFRAGHGRRWGVPATEIAEASELVVVWGCNPVSTHVNFMTHVARARRARGARLVVIDPYRSPTAEVADLHLALRPGTDAALACGVMHLLFREGYADREYLRRYADDPEGLERHLATRTPEWAAAITGLEVSDIVRFARLYGSTRRSYLRLGFGFTRSRNGAVNMHAASCLPVVTGAWQYRGGGALYNMGDLYHLDKTLIEGLDLLDRRVRLLDQSRIGPILLGEPEALGGGPPVTAMLVQNTNPMCVAPDLGKVHRGFAREDLFLCVHEQFLTDTAAMADIVLPATMFLEHDDIYQASCHPTLQISRKLFDPPGEARPNHFVVCELARRLDVADHPGFAMSEWELIDDLLRRSGWPDAETVHRQGGLDVLPDFETAHFLDGFATPHRRFRLRPDWSAFGPLGASLPEWPDYLPTSEAPTMDRPFRLVAAPARSFLNTTFTETPSSQAREKEPTAFLHPATMHRLGLRDGDLVRIGNRRGSLVVRAKARDGQQPETVVVESIWPNGAFREGIGVNLLIGSDPAPPRGGAAIHDTAVWLEPASHGRLAERTHAEAGA